MTFEDAKNMALNVLNDAETDALYVVEKGVAYVEDIADEFKSLVDKGLARVVNFEHVRAETSIPGLVLSEDGQQVLNVANQDAAVKTVETTVVEDGQNVTQTTVQVNPTAIDDTAEVVHADGTTETTTTGAAVTDAEAASQTPAAAAPDAPADVAETPAEQPQDRPAVNNDTKPTDPDTDVKA